MLKKLLKYDLRYMFKIWWIGAVTLIVLSVIGGFCINNLMYSTSDNVFADIFSTLFLIPLFLAIAAFSLYPTVVSFIRIYKNFFSDEGYLTFTLPVKLTSLINSKIISALILQSSSVFVIILSIFLIVIGATNNFPGFFKSMCESIGGIFNYLGIHTIFFVIEIIALLLLVSLFSILFLFICITFGCIIAKKAKVIASIGIYYAVNSVSSFILQILTYMVFPGISVWISDFPEGNTKLCVLLFGLVAILVLSVLCGLLYLLQYYMLERKLNLA